MKRDRGMRYLDCFLLDYITRTIRKSFFQQNQKKIATFMV